MSTMICGNCRRVGIEWKGPLSNLTHTECPHCGGVNCQEVFADELSGPTIADMIASGEIAPPDGISDGIAANDTPPTTG